MTNCSTSRHVETFQIQRATPRNRGGVNKSAHDDSASSQRASGFSVPRNAGTANVTCAGPSSAPGAPARTVSLKVGGEAPCACDLAFHRNNQRYTAPANAVMAVPGRCSAKPATNSTPNSGRSWLIEADSEQFSLTGADMVPPHA